MDYSTYYKPYHFKHLVIFAHIAGQYATDHIFSITAENINAEVAKVVENTKYDRAVIVNQLINASYGNAKKIK